MSAEYVQMLMEAETVIEGDVVAVRFSDNTRLHMALDVFQELTDPEYLNRQHYSRATYAKNCHGPLCRLAETHRGRKRNAERAQDEGREYREGHRANDRSEELAPIIAWHLHARGRKIRVGS